MPVRIHTGTVALLFAVASAVASCSSDEDVASQRQPGGAGGDSGSSGGSATGGTAGAGQSGAGGASGAAGAEPVCPPYCDALIGAGCTAAPDEASCNAFCDAVLAQTTQGGCGAQTETLLDCYANQPASAYSCDANGNPVVPAAACQSSTDALDECLCTTACNAIVAAGCPGTDQASCELLCEGLRDGCPACADSYRGALVCEANQPPSAYQCNAQGGTERAPGTCMQQIADWQACTASQCPPP